MSPLLPVYNRTSFGIERGEGVYLYTTDGRKMLDFASGIAVNALGHCHPHLVKALTQQAKKLWHVSNLYQIPGQQQLAERLTQLSHCNTAFFCNSGAEAVETAIKMTRKYFYENGKPERFRIITLEGGFHGRTIGAISAAGQSKFTNGFVPLLDGFDHAYFNNLDSIQAFIGEHTAAIMLEPIQGEGGIREVDVEILKKIRKLCDKHEILLIADEVQCGTGRTGKFFAFEHAEIQPDIICMAKGIGGGFPLAACLATEKAASGMTPGSHGGTYGGNPLAMAVGNAVLDVILDGGFLEDVTQKGKTLYNGLCKIQKQFPTLYTEVRGKGLMLGLQTKIETPTIVNAYRDHGLLTVPASDNVIRVVPPLSVTKDEIAEALDYISQASQSLETSKAA